MPELVDLLRVLEDAPASEAEMCCALVPQVLLETRALVSRACDRGLVDCRYRKWYLTDEGRILLSATERLD